MLQFPRKQAAQYLRDNPLTIVVIVGACLSLSMLLLPVSSEHTILAPQGEKDRFYFGGASVVGQEFAPPRGLSRIRIPLGVATDRRGPLILHVRERPDAPDLRSSVTFSFEGEEAQFNFAPLLAPPSVLFWVLEAPHATAKSFWVYREKDATKSVAAALSGTTRITGNFGFTLVQRLPLVVAWFDPTPTETHWSVASVASWEWYSLLFAAATVGLYAGWRHLGRRSWPEPVLVGLLIFLNVVLHIGFAAHLPLINDEGAYVQDVLQAKASFIPLRDYLTKGPAYLALLKIWQLIMPHTILGWRLFATVSWGAAIYAAWLLCRRLALSQPMRLVAVALMAVSPAVVAVTTPLLLQTTSVPIVLLALLAAIKGSQESRRSLIVLAAILINIAFFVRVSSVIGGLIALVYIGYYSRHRWVFLRTYICTGLLVFLLLFIVAIATVGWQRALVTINAEALLISAHRGELAQASADNEPLIRQLTHGARLFWRGAPLLIIGFFATPLLFVTRLSLLRSTAILLVLAGILSLVYLHLSDANYLLPAPFALAQPILVITIFGGIITLTIVLLTGQVTQPERTKTPIIFWLSTLVLWLVVLTFIYVQWGRFRQNYLVEFIPPLALISGISLVAGWRVLTQVRPVWLSNFFRLAGVFLTATMFYQGMYIVWHYPHTGSIAQGSLQQFIIKTEQVVPPGEVIFTAQPNVTAFSLRPIIFGNSHPGWYREVRFGTIPASLRDLFFVHPEAVTQYLRDEANYVVMERRTYEIYFDGYTERQQILAEHFTKVVSVDNEREEEPLELYERTTRAD